MTKMYRTDDKVKEEVCARCNTKAINRESSLHMDDNGLAWFRYTCNCGYLKREEIALDKDGFGYVED